MTEVTDFGRAKSAYSIIVVVDKVVERIKKEGALLKAMTSHLSGLPPFFKSETQEVAYYCARELLSATNRKDLEDMWQAGQPNISMETKCDLSDDDLLQFVAKMCAKLCEEELNNAS